MQRFAFVSGLILGGGVSAWLLGSALCYLFTGKLPSIEVRPGQRPRLTLIDPGRLYEVPPVASQRAWGTEKEAV